MPAQITCQQCQTAMTVPPSRVGRRRFCSRACYGLWMAENLTGEKAPRWRRGHTRESRQKMSATKKAAGRTGSKATTWKGGRYMSRGYVMVKLSELSPEEQEMFGSMAKANDRSYIPEHRLVIARSIGRALLSTEVVHHHNGVKDDNRLSNLELHESNGSHRMKHAEIDAEMFRLRRENAALRALLLTFCAATALPGGSTTST